MRLFIAILPPASLQPRIAQAASRLHERMGVRVLSPGNWHITLRFIGDVGDEKFRQKFFSYCKLGAKRYNLQYNEKAGEIGRALSAVKFSPFTVRLRGAGAYPSEHFPRAIWIGGKSEGAAALAAEIERVLSPFNLQREKFSVHLTVARSKGAGDIEDFVKQTGDVGEFEVRSFCLLKSSLLPHGASYEVLREYKAQV
jgi:2'-5' RNA ligase